MTSITRKQLYTFNDILFINFQINIQLLAWSKKWNDMVFGSISSTFDVGMYLINKLQFYLKLL